MNPGTRIIVFLKAPQPALVKTRLAVSIGREAALNAYKRLVEATLSKLNTEDSVELRFTPDYAAKEIEPWSKGCWLIKAQGEGDLGQRLEKAVQESFEAGFSKVIVIGSDCPHFTRDDLLTAEQALNSHPVVIGPAIDGGYWLIGLSQPVPELFREIPWSTDQVLETTLQRARELQLQAALLRRLEDVDTIEAWNRFLVGDGSK